VERFENVVILTYYRPTTGKGLPFTGISIVARDGRLVSGQAWSCTWQRTFFEEWPREEQEAFWRRYWAHQEALRQGRAEDP
jgi:hypothetical protein